MCRFYNDVCDYYFLILSVNHIVTRNPVPIFKYSTFSNSYILDVQGYFSFYLDLST